jgi:hypothetical protein
MSTKYFCDVCDHEIQGPSSLGTRPIANLQFIDPSTGKQTVKMCCQDCTKKVSDYFDKIKSEHNIKIIIK